MAELLDGGGCWTSIMPCLMTSAFMPLDVEQEIRLGML